jgi:hypothetical protein
MAGQSLSNLNCDLDVQPWQHALCNTSKFDGKSSCIMLPPYPPSEAPQSMLFSWPLSIIAGLQCCLGQVTPDEQQGVIFEVGALH